MINSNYGTLGGTLTIKQGDEVIYSSENGELKFVEDKWIWVDAYKGTDKDMKCRDMQYELGKQYEFDGEPEICKKGYHCCLKLEDVFRHYEVMNNNRFFKVRALVRESEVNNYGKRNFLFDDNTKLAAKKIRFVSEVTSEEIFTTTNRYQIKAEHKDYFDMAREYNPGHAYKEYLKDNLVNFGYPEEVAEFMREHCDKWELEKAYKYAKAPGMSLDTKYVLIFKD